MQPDAGHAMNLGAAAQVLLPAWQLRIDRTERHEQAASVAAAFVGESGIHRANVLVQNTVETAGPRLQDTLTPEHGDECAGIIAAHATQWPAREIYVHIDELAAR